MEGYSGDGGVEGVQCMFWGVVTKFVHANCIDIPIKVQARVNSEIIIWLAGVVCL